MGTGGYILSKDIITDDWIRNRIKVFEGYSEKVYTDPLGFPTGGWGHHFAHGSALPKSIWEKIFDYDYWVAERDCDRLGLDLDPVRRAVVIDLIFNMGIHKVKAFVKMLTALRNKEWLKAHDELLNSRYAQQVGRRARENANLLAKGDIT